MSIDVEARLRDALDSREVADIIGPLESGEVTLLARFLAARLVPAEDEGRCWFCHRTVPVSALIAGYDTFEEQRLACLACDERIQRPAEDEGRLREAVEAFIAHLDSAPRGGWVDNDPDMLVWMEGEYRCQQAIRAALAATPEPR